jgi:hypothetical protein
MGVLNFSREPQILYEGNKMHAGIQLIIPPNRVRPASNNNVKILYGG